MKLSLTLYSDSLYIGLLDKMGEVLMEENNNTQKEQKRAILVQKDALQKPLQHGLSITLSYEFIKTFKPEFAEMSDQELRNESRTIKRYICWWCLCYDRRNC